MKRRRLLSCLLLIVLATIVIGLVTPKAVTVVRLAMSSSPSVLPVPVRGVALSALADTWGAARSEGRRHRGIDIFAERGTPVISPVDGLVLDVGHDRLGGNVVKVLGPGLQVHYFAHLNGFGPLDERGLIRRGDIVGYVGDSGNAEGTPPHLHYGIYVLPGKAVNPYPLLTQRS